MIVTELADHVVAALSIASAHFDFDEFVVRLRRLKFSQYGIGQPGIADGNSRFERVAAATQVLFLRFTEFHGREVYQCDAGTSAVDKVFR